MMRIEKDVALIDNPLLRAAIWGDQSCLYKSVKFTGYVQASIDKIGKAFIEYCIARALGIYRLPNCVQIPLHRITDSASNGSVFPVVTEHFSASSDHAFL